LLYIYDSKNKLFCYNSKEYIYIITFDSFLFYLQHCQWGSKKRTSSIIKKKASKVDQIVKKKPGKKLKVAKKEKIPRVNKRWFW
jgi:hypothetical protein